MKLRIAAVFAAGYVLGTRAGRERYAQIVDGMAKGSQRPTSSVPVAARAARATAPFVPMAIPDHRRRTRDAAPRSRAATVGADIGKLGASLLAQFERERPQIGGFGTDGSCQALDLVGRWLHTG